MKSLMDGNFDDGCLPIERREAQTPHSLTLIGKGAKWWKDGRIGKFYEEKWRFLAPVFSIGTEDNDSDREFRTPYNHALHQEIRQQRQRERGRFRPGEQV